MFFLVVVIVKLSFRQGCAKLYKLCFYGFALVLVSCPRLSYCPPQPSVLTKLALSSSFSTSSTLDSRLDTMSDAAPPTHRIVPGAPPPTPLSKSQQKKKRKVAGMKRPDGEDGPDVASPKDAALIDHVPSADHTDPSLLAPPEESAVAAAASEMVANIIAPSFIDPILANAPKKTSAVVELVNKRYRAMTKKIVRSPFSPCVNKLFPDRPARRVMSKPGATRHSRRALGPLNISTPRNVYETS